MVFVLQNSQNRDSAALHLKLDEIITHLEGPRDDVAGVEEKSHEEIEELQAELAEGDPSRPPTPEDVEDLSR
jgi:low affinity Fe/Cu permease